jgi:hypothetical protein
MDKETKFREGVIEHLNVYNGDIEEVLSQLLKHDYPSEVKSLDFEIFVDGFSNEFPVRAFFMDEDNSEFFIYKNGIAEYPSPVDPSLLNIPYVYSDDFENQFTENDDDFDPWSLATEELINWFSERWLAIGGASFKLNATIAPHDTIHVFDLVKSQWIQK